MIEISISFWFVLVSAILHMALGLLWYSPILFGHEWMILVGKDPKQAGADMKGMGPLLVQSFAAALVMSYVLAVTYAAFAPQSLYAAFSVAILIWLGLSAATNIGEYIFLKKPLKLFLINNGYNLVTFLVIAALFRVWY